VPARGRILVFGSLNTDVVQRVTRLPRAGETVHGADLATFTGGKGANQSCAAARLGGRAFMAGIVGEDSFGAALLADLQALGVDVALVGRSPRKTGTATILVLPDGDNAIVLSPGANADVGAALAAQAVAGLTHGDCLLCQLEVPLQATHAALCLARARGVCTILDPAPAGELPDELLQHVDILTPNQTEASTLLDWKSPVATLDEARAAADALRTRGARNVIVKLGALGCLVSSSSDSVHVPAVSGEVIDTTAAGDTFNGALAVSLQEGRELVEAARFAVCAASLSVRRRGAIASIPSRSEVDAMLRS